MSPKPFAIAALAAAALLTVARAQPAAPPPTPAGFVQARQASLDTSLWTRGQMELAMKSGQEAKTQAYPAHALARWAHVLPTLFPAGTGPGQTSETTQALAPVWADRPGFLKAAANYAAAADKLSELAQANDTEGFKAQLAVVHQACDACHTTYKGGMQGPPGKPAN
jgi:cytochrome c556